MHLAGDGTATWTDPTGRDRTTAPLDALEEVVLATERPPPTTRHGSPTGATPSTLETLLTVHVEHVTAEVDRWVLTHALPPTHRRCTSAAQLRASPALRRLRASLPDIPPF